MKKLVSLLLVLVTATVLSFGALAETAVDYVGDWELFMVMYEGQEMDPAALGMSAFMTLNEDGTCSLTSNGVEETGTWVLTDIGIAMTDASADTMELTYVEGTLMTAAEGITMYFTPVVYASVLSGLTLADFNGTWTLEHVETTMGSITAEEAGAGMTVVLKDGVGSVSLTADGITEAEEVACEIEEVPELGTVLYAIFGDETTEEAGAFMFMLFDDGQLVWYEYDDVEQMEYYYCFNYVVE